jgi:hypothetical protein
MKNLYLCSLMSLLIGAISFGQNLQNANWVFGLNNTFGFLPFSAPHTVASIPASLGFSTMEGCASVSDVAGNLLLFSDGVRLWHNSGGTITLLTSGLMGGDSSAQNVIFVPRPNNPFRYYVVTISGATSGQKGIHYSEVDFSGTPFMVLINIPLMDMTGIPIESPFITNISEALTSTVHADNSNYWVVAVVKSGGDAQVSVLSYLVTQNGFEDATAIPNRPSQETIYTLPDASDMPTIMKISRDTKHIAINQSFIGTYVGGFDNTSGLVTLSGFLPVEPSATIYGLEFSPNSKVLYYDADVISGTVIYRIDVPALSNLSSEILPFTNNPTPFFMGIQLGLDDRLYVAMSANELAVIDNPDVLTDPLIIDNYIPLQNPARFGLPQWVWEQQENPCFATLTEITDVSVSTPVHTQRSQWIRATNDVLTGSEALYHAGNFLEFNPGFEAEKGARFAAYIEDCSGIFSYRMQGKESKNQAADKIIEQLSIYPNPSDKSVMISYASGLRNIKMYSLDGKIMIDIPLNTSVQEIDVSVFEKGVYLISAESSEGKIMKAKFIKN